MTPRSAGGSAVILALALLTGCRTDPGASVREHVAAAERYSQGQQHREAARELEAALRIAPDDAKLHVQLANALAALNETGRALEEYTRGSDLASEDIAIQLEAGKFFILHGKFSEARARAERALAIEPRNLDAQLLRGNALLGLRDFTRAISEIEQAIRLDPAQGRAQASLGLAQMASGNQEQARLAFEKAVALAPDSIDARLSLAGFYWVSGDLASAERALQQILTTSPGHAVTNRTLAALYLGTGRMLEAEACLKRAADTGDTASRLALADYYILQRKFREATSVLNQLASVAEARDEVTTQLAVIAYAEGRKEQAHAAIDDLLKLSPSSAPALLIKARFLLAENNADQALPRLEAAVKAEPQLVAAHYLRGIVLVARNDLDGAAAAFSEVLKLNPRMTAAQQQLARISMARGHKDLSLSLARDLVKARPDDRSTRIMLIDSLIMSGKTAEAEGELAPMLAQAQDDADLLLRAGRIATIKGDYAAAQRAFERSMRIEPRSLDALSGLVAVDIAQKRPAEAIKRVELQLARMPDDPLLLMLAARTYLAGGRLADAESSLEKIVRSGKANSATYALLGQILLSERKLDQARSRFEALLEKNPHDSGVETMVGLTYQLANRPDEARKRYEAVLSRDPHALVAANNLAWMLAESGSDLDRARQLAESARRDAPRDASIAHTLGLVYYRMHLIAQAIPLLEEAARANSTNALVFYHLALAHTDAGDTARARASLERALSLNNSFEGAADARSRLAALKD